MADELFFGDGREEEYPSISQHPMIEQWMREAHEAARIERHEHPTLAAAGGGRVEMGLQESAEYLRQVAIRIYANHTDDDFVLLADGLRAVAAALETLHKRFEELTRK